MGLPTRLLLCLFWKHTTLGVADTLHSHVIQSDKVQPLAVGVQQQALQRLKVAAAPCNHRRWRAPAVVFHFPSGVAESVRDELSSIGVHVTGPGALHGEAGCAAAAARLPASGSSKTLRYCNTQVQPEHLQQAGLSTSSNLSILTLVPAASMLPAPPPEPAAVNLDVTTLCAMVSEVCNSDVTRPDIQQWAARVSHWQVRCFWVKVVVTCV